MHLLDTAAEAGFVYMPYTHGYNNSPEMLETLLDAVAEYPGHSAAMAPPVATLNEFYRTGTVVSNRWVTPIDHGPPDYSLSSGSKAIGSANVAAVSGWPDLEDMNGHAITDSNGVALVAPTFLSMGAYQPVIVPTLQISATNGLLNLMWQATPGSWSLQTSTNLASPATWEPVAGSPVLVGSHWTLPVDVTEPGDRQRFYQLQLQ